MHADPAVFLTPDSFAADGYPWAGWAELRANDPVSRVENDLYDPFWAVTRHADILRVSRDPQGFASQPGNTLVRRDLREQLVRPRSLAESFRSIYSSGLLKHPRLVRALMAAGKEIRRTANPSSVIPMLLNMDPPVHRDYRDATRSHFTPRALMNWHERVERVARDTVSRVAERAKDPARRSEPFDFVAEIAAPFPLEIIAELMGFPREDWGQLFAWSNGIIGIEDEEYGDAEDPLGGAERAQLGLFEYFARHLKDRRRNPGDDLVTIIAQARVDGRPLPVLQSVAYCFLLLIAGNETTRNALSGGMAALIEHPGELKRLREDPTLLETAPDEIVRWTSPIIYFLRTATRDVDLGGRQIRAGDQLALYYPSANRDETVFEDPERFDVSRKPNRHLGFGIGEHFCLGAHLARMEMRAALAEILAQLPDLQLAGPTSCLRSDFVGGVKHLPVRFR